MITIKLPYESTPKFQEVLKQLRKEYSSVVRYSFKKFHEKITQKDVRNSLKALNNIHHLNSWMKQCAIMEGNQLFQRFRKQPDIIFGGKHNFKLRVQNKITKEQFNEKRLLPLNIQGELLQNGNRQFNLQIIDENIIEFKLNKKEHFFLRLPKIKNNYKKKLALLQTLNEDEGYTYSVRINDKFIFISFDEINQEKSNELKINRYLGIDMNPDTIGISIHESGEIIHAQEYSLKMIFDKIIESNLSSSSDKMKYFQNKLKHEVIEISKSISKLAKHYQCQNVFVESLKFKSKLSSTQKRNHKANRKNRNLWKRVLFKENLSKRLALIGIKIHEVNPAYSSFIGNLQHDYTDSINASIEIARRGYEYRINKNKDSFYPIVTLKNSIQHLRKEMGIEIGDNWKKLFLKLKNSKVKYRVSLDECSHEFDVFRLNHSKKSCINLYRFR